MAFEFWQHLTANVLERGSRSSVVTTLVIMGGLLASAMVGSLYGRAPDWVPIFFATLLGLDFIAFLCAYAYFARTAPDALRSEKFYLQKMAIERGYVGDAHSGLFPANEPKLIGEGTAESKSTLSELPPPNEQRLVAHARRETRKADDE
jgi:hypothetical protein